MIIDVGLRGDPEYGHNALGRLLRSKHLDFAIVTASYATFESGFLQQTLLPAQVQLAKLGAPHDSILVDDLALAEMKRLKNWTFICTLNPVLPAAFLRALARQAGVHIYSDRDDTFYASRSYVCRITGVLKPVRRAASWIG